MTIYKYKTKTEKAWDKSSYCYCNNEVCTPNNHRLCGICMTTILYDYHENEKSQNNSRFSWNTDHIVSKSRGGNNSINNLQAVHIRCNRSKSDQSGEY